MANQASAFIGKYVLWPAMVAFVLTVLAGHFLDWSGGVPYPSLTDNGDFRVNDGFPHSSESEIDLAPASELVLIFVGSPTCSWSVAEHLPDLTEQIVSKISTWSTRHDLAFRTIGIAKSSTVIEGVRFLGELVEFDEVIAGGGWNNVGLLRYAHDLPSGEAATPQLLVVRREPAGDLRYEERVVRRVVGLRHIELWLENGLALNETALPPEAAPH